MPVTVRNADILFNDGTTQGTAAGALTTTAVLNATAGASLGAVGTYAWLGRSAVGDTSYNEGSTYAGSVLRYAGIRSGSPQAAGGTPAGTWRAMGNGRQDSEGFLGATIFLRIS